MTRNSKRSCRDPRRTHPSGEPREARWISPLPGRLLPVLGFRRE